MSKLDLSEENIKKLHQKCKTQDKDLYMFLKDPINDDRILFMGNANNTLKTVIGVSAVVTISSIIFIEPLIELISYYVQNSGY